MILVQTSSAAPLPWKKVSGTGCTTNAQTNASSSVIPEAHVMSLAYAWISL